jgi:outer membrane receptor protein involved in Fe transport
MRFSSETDGPQSTAGSRDRRASSQSPPAGGLGFRGAWLLIWLLGMGLAAQAQEAGVISGRVVSTWDGTPLPGVTVSARGTTLAAQTDGSGRYELKNVPPGEQVLRFSKSGFASAVVTDVRVLIGQTTTVNGSLRPEFYEMEEYEVTAEEFAEQTEKIMIERQQASSMVDAIGSEQFSKLGAGDAGQIVSRVTGVSVVGGKYVVVRGLSDRYTRTLLNGLEVPSADPYRSSPQLDMFPSTMIERVVVSKTFTPDQPGGTGGGMIDIITRSFPEKPFVKFGFGTSYNPNSNLKKNFLADPDTSMAMIAFPSAPNVLNSSLWGLTNAPDPPGPASSRETPARAAERAQAANDVQALNENLGTANFAGVSKTSPLNSSFNASGGATVPLFGHDLGMFAGVNYNRNFRLVDNGTVNRYGALGNPKRLGQETVGNVLTDYGANVNLGYDLSEYAEFGFNFMLAHSTDQEARHATFGFVEGREDTLEQWQLHNTDRDEQNYQLNGRHTLPFLADSRVDWGVGLANTTQDEPDYRFMNYYVTPAGQPTFGDAALPYPQNPSRYYRKIDEDSYNYRGDWTLPLAFMKQDSRLKAGLAGSHTDRDFKEQYFTYVGSDGFDLQNPNSYLNNPAYLQYTTEYLGGIRTNYTFQRYVGDAIAAPYTASQDIKAEYLMADISVLPRLRLIGGVRREHTDIHVDAGQAGTGKIDQNNLLPAASTVITLVTNFSLRLSYGETVARPSFREMAPVFNYLPDLGVIALGNPDLEMTDIKSYDARLEWFPAPGDIISAGIFFKQLDRPIELYSRSLTDENVTWINRTNGTSTVMGIEFEVRQSLDFMSPHLKGLALGANITFMESKTDLTDTEIYNKTNSGSYAKDRPLYYTSPYVINLELSYDHPRSGTSLIVGANLTGERIVIATAQGQDVYEHPPITLDAAVTQKFWKHWTFRFGVRNILDPEFRQTYGEDYNGKIYQSYKRGRTFGVTLSAEF